MKRCRSLSRRAACCGSAQAQGVADFYKGKTIRMVVGIDVGSGYDVNARLLARHLVNHIPGNPAIVVQNQPGAGSANMTAQVYTNGPFDGTVIGAAFAGMPTLRRCSRPAAASRFDLTKLNWLGNTNRETHVTYVWHKSPVQSFDELRTKELIMGAQAPGSSQVDFPLVANALFNLKHKVITGYGSHRQDQPRDGVGRSGRRDRRADQRAYAELAVAGGEEDQDHHAMGAAHEPRSARRAERARSRQDRRAARRACS